MPTQPNPAFFNWGGQFQDGIQRSQDNRRRNAMLDLDQRQVGMQEQQIGMQQNKLDAETRASERSRRSRVAGLQHFGFSAEQADALADDEDFPQLFAEITKGDVGATAPSAQRLAQWLANDATPRERAALQYTLRANAGKLADVAGVPTVINANLNEMPDFDSFGPVPQPQGFPSGGGAVPTMAPYEPSSQPPAAPRPQAPRASGGARPLSTLQAEADAAATIKGAEAAASASAQAGVEAGTQNKQKANATVMWDKALGGLKKGLAGTSTGYFAGRVPAVTAGQQVADSSVAALAPILKQIFRVAGEGTFTDRDQAMLLDMIPTRKISPEARDQIIKNIDDIVKAKLGAVPTSAPAGARRFNPATGKIE